MAELVPNTLRPIVVGNSMVQKFIIKPINFVGYAECFSIQMKELARTNNNDMMGQKAFLRARLSKQVTAIDPGGTEIPLQSEDFLGFSRDVFVKLNNLLSAADPRPRGKVISPQDHDGVHKPIIYQLGTPFDYIDTKIGDKPIGTVPKIIELEFQAKTGGDIEEVLCSNNNLDQTLALIKTCATPLGGDTSLLRLPSWMIASLTLEDGLEIMSKVTPIFVE